MDAFTLQQSTESVASGYFHQASATRINTDAYTYDTISNAHPSIPITIVPEFNCNLRAHATSGHASIALFCRQGDARRPDRHGPALLRLTRRIRLPPHSVERDVIFYGPPGNGKTMSIKATCTLCTSPTHQFLPCTSNRWSASCLRNIASIPSSTKLAKKHPAIVSSRISTL